MQAAKDLQRRFLDFEVRFFLDVKRGMNKKHISTYLALLNLKRSRL